MPKKFVLLIGPQGSGKSTYCEKRLSDYLRISQDDQDDYLEILIDAMKKDVEKIVVDRTNPTREGRLKFLSKAQKLGYETKIIWFNCSKDDCLIRIQARHGHPTINRSNAMSALDWFFSKLQFPAACEADEIEIIGTPNFVPVKDIREEIDSRRYIIVGDIHGCLDQLEALLDQMCFDRDEDVLVSVGDLVDRGPKIRETVEFCMGLPRFYSVLGNHDYKCLRHFENHAVKMSSGLKSTVDSFNGGMPPVVVDFFKTMPLIIRVPDGYVVHAGFDPMLPPEQQRSSDCMFMRHYGGDGYNDKFAPYWATLWPLNGPNVFFGHHVDPKGNLRHNVYPLDGGSVFGGYLKAYDSLDKIVYYQGGGNKYLLS